MIILPLETYFVVGKVCFFTRVSERPWNVRMMELVLVPSLMNPSVRARRGIGLYGLIGISGLASWGVEFSHPFPTLDSVEIYRFSASKVVITHPFLIRPKTFLGGGVPSDLHENFSPSHHKVLSENTQNSFGKMDFSPEKGIQWDVTTRDLWMWLVLVFLFFSFFWLQQLVLWRSRRKFFTKSEKSFLEDASKNVIIEVSRCNLCYPCFFVGGRAGSTIKHLVTWKINPKDWQVASPLVSPVFKGCFKWLWQTPKADGICFPRIFWVCNFSLRWSY